MSITARNLSQEPPLSDTRHLSALKGAERSMELAPAESAVKEQNLATDVVMLQKADIWISQFKTRLNVGIIALVVLWGGVSYYKSTGLHARTAPNPEEITEQVTSDDTPMMVHAVEGDSLRRGEAAEMLEASDTAVMQQEKHLAPTKATKKKLVHKNGTSKTTGGKNQSRNQKKVKRSLAVKSAP